jgi:hypothetical protein
MIFCYKGYSIELNENVTTGAYNRFVFGNQHHVGVARTENDAKRLIDQRLNANEEMTFTSAWSSMYCCRVEIVSTYLDQYGQRIFIGENTETGLVNHLFRKNELNSFN